MTLHVGDVRDVLPTLPDASVQMCVTSPPYWGLRDYGSEGQLGLEPTPEEYTANMVEVFREVRRVLRDDGVLWLNLGDSYAGPPVGRFNGGGFKDKSAASEGRDLSGIESGSNRSKVVSGLKPKDLVGIPWRVAFALQADGWWLRQDIIWHKPNPMPESVTDRCTKSHEYLFMLTKSARYFYDAEAIAERAVAPEFGKYTDRADDKQRGHSRRHAGFNGRYADKLARDGVPEPATAVPSGPYRPSPTAARTSPCSHLR